MLQYGINVYSDMWKRADHRIDGWLMMSSIQPTLTLLVLYCGLVFFGPILMQKRKPYDLKLIIIIYNIFAALMSLYIAAKFTIGAFGYKSKWHCEVATDPKNTTAEEMTVITASFIFTLSKPIEWFDTLFFILRKKNNQMSFLHVYHHAATFLVCWFVTRFTPSGPAIFTFLLNAYIHVIMYSYYALAALGPSVQKYLWWKKYITVMQMIQFVVGMIILVVSMATKCTFKQWENHAFLYYVASLLYLFSKFYKSAYKKHSP